MKALESYTQEEVVEERIYEISAEFQLPYKQSKQILLNILAEHEFGEMLLRRAKEYYDEPSRWIVQAVEPTQSAEKVLVTLECPECGSEYWFKVRKHSPDDISKNAHGYCPSCGRELKPPKMIVL